MKNPFLFVFFSFMIVLKSTAQIDINKIFDLNDIVGKVLNVKKGFAPKFSIGKIEIPKIAKVAEVFNVKGNTQAIKLFNIFKTGRTIYRIAAYAGSAVALYGTIKAIDKAAVAKDYQGALLGGLTTIGVGLLSKFLTKAAAYKAVDVFNGIAIKKIKDILSIRPASSALGVGLYVKL